MEKIKFPHILIYDSSAGSGKTHQLALRYLHLLLTDQKDVKRHISNLLAITFTNKSAREMKKRIIEWMKRIILDESISEKDKKKKIIEAVQEKVILEDEKEMQVISLSSSEIRSRISNVFEGLLKNFSDFKVSTIDSFVTLILKASAFKLGLSPDFEITLDMDPYLDRTIDRIFQDILEKESVRNVFDKFIENYSFIKKEGINWFPKDFLKKNIKEIWKQVKQRGKHISVDKDEMKRFDREKIKIASELKKSVKEFYASLNKEIEDKGLLVNKNYLNWFNKFFFTEDLVKLRKPAVNQKRLEEALNKGSALPSKLLSAQWEKLSSGIKDYYIKLTNYYYFHLIEIFDLFEENLYREVRSGNNVILIQELNDLLNGILIRTEEDPSLLPELYYYLSARYYHFLIDEFQDTNFLQWNNLSILTQEALAGGGSLFIVGDKKQAIYNWRGASSELMDHIKKDFDAGYTYHSSLDVNYRSAPGIVRFNNLLFTGDNIARSLLSSEFLDQNRDKVISTYQDCDQKPFHSSDSGYIYVKRIVRKNSTVEEIDDDIRDEFLNIIKRIKKDDLYNEKDICVLCRKNSQVNQVVNWLLQEKIHVESDTTVDIRNNEYINEIVSLVEFLNEPDNDFAFMNFLSGSIFRSVFKEEQDIFSWIHGKLIDQKEKLLYKCLKEAYPEFWEKYFSDIFNYAGYYPAYELLLFIMKKWGVFQNFSSFAPYFLKLLEVIKGLENSGETGIHNLLQAFLKSDNQNKLFLLNTGGGIDAVKVMTLHESKGLEFPVVILPFTDVPGRNKEENIFFSESQDHLDVFRITKEDTELSEPLYQIYHNNKNERLMEEINTLYVGFTRAQEELYVLLPESVKTDNRVIDLIFNHDD
ncbi:MAG: UvrD-helicase domain-containing protein, partial [Spirochaetes bacterium]|nr:UvrD-helicase domain-containing protein [Spirochaetota bacterium]